MATATSTKKQAVSTGLRRGGVSPRPNAPALHGGETIVEPRAPINTSAAFANFTYHGGPVVSCAQVYASFWGSGWLGDPAQLERASRLSQFCKDLVGSKFMNVLSQYGVNGGLFVRSSFVTNVATTLTDAAIHGVIQASIDAGVFPEPTSPSQTITLMIFLDDTIGVNDPGQGLVLCEAAGDDAFGYHNFFTTKAGHPFYYAVIPGLSDTCLKASCASDVGCSLHLAETQEQRQTQVASHEFAEMTTDPQLNAWFDPGAGENGDICNGESASLIVGNNVWNVQRTYSKTDDIKTNGASFCLSESPTAIPKLSPGPAAGLAFPAALMEAGHPLLPLPSVIFDAKSKKATLDEKHVRDFVKRIAAPLHHSHIVADLPSLLRQVADIIAK
jgi:hypothetical protein